MTQCPRACLLVMAIVASALSASCAQVAPQVCVGTEMECAFKAAQKDVRDLGTQEVPLHLRNAPTKLMKEIGYGKNYQYDHDLEGGIALDQTGFPDKMGERVYYEPVSRGLEIKLKEKLDALREARAQAQKNNQEQKK